jgi:membrane-associated phospholipid phosphatase
MEAVKERLVQYGVDTLICVVFFSISALCQYVMPPFDRFFVERDPTLSFPYEKDLAHGETIPNWLIIIISLPVPLFLIVSWILFWKYFIKLQVKDSRILDWFLGILAFLEAVAMNLALTTFLKNFIGRKRPNFFAMCNYQGYRDALLTGNYTYYHSHTIDGSRGDLSNCLEDDIGILRDSQYSFPSGHASSIFCALVFLGLLMTITLRNYTTRHVMIKGIFLATYIWTACIIAGTRPRDYWHNFDDILAGAMVGTAMAFTSFYLNYIMHPHEYIDPSSGENTSSSSVTLGKLPIGLLDPLVNVSS